jgi:hypothetical protein
MVGAMSTTVPHVRIRYAGPAGLLRDHQTYFRHGGCILPLELASNLRVRIRIELGDDHRFELQARTAQSIPAQGIMVSFEPLAQPDRDRLDGLVATLEVEPAPPGRDAPTVETFDPAPLASEPKSGPPSGSSELVDPDEAAALADALPDVAEPPPDERWTYVVKFTTLVGFEPYQERFLRDQGLGLPEWEEARPIGSPVQLRLILPGYNVFEIGATVDAVSPVLLRAAPDDPAYEKAVAYLSSAAARTRREGEAQRATEPEPPDVRRFEAEPDEDEGDERMPLRRRLQRMGMEEKINLALTGDREMRMALASDTNRAIHPYLLKNRQITIHEIAHLARLPTTNPDVLERIADHKPYTQNSAVLKSLVFNPKTPISTSIRLLDRLPRSELQQIARRSSMHQRLVMAAKKKLGG